ncbi:MAG: MBOAT family protein [Chitinophagaceae bacterium]|nr:MAG: MBOAT family protein [Chitinophagaceae bacterium]
MIFNSYTFVLFFALVLLLHNLPLGWKTKKTNLLLASYIFYAAWNPPFILLLWLSTVVDFFVGKALYHQTNQRKRRALLLVSLAGNLGMLFFFKYGSFLLENFTLLVNALGMDYHPAKPNIILPAGISFYTFTTLCYTIDMYKRHTRPVSNLLDFSLFVTFFPHLVAGPIVRPEQLVPQFSSPRKATGEQLRQGLYLLSLGLFLKVVLADALLAGTANTVFGFAGTLASADAWAGLLAFSGQIFFDFAGYSTCAIGAAMCLGFWLPDNFRAPYAAIGFSDFWKRWHITLSSWLRDYLYIPLGGNRGTATRTYINLMLTMLLGGLWHGASWTFVVWGALHGAYLCIERLFTSRPESPPALRTGSTQVLRPAPVAMQAVVFPLPRLGTASKRIAKMLLTFFLVNIAWVFFRATDFRSAWRMLVSLFGFQKEPAAVLPSLDLYLVGVITILLLIAHWRLRNSSNLEWASHLSWWKLALVWSFMLIALVLSQKSGGSFIYFQF